MTNVDYTALRPTLDPEGAYERNLGLPQQCREAWEDVRGFTLPESYRYIDNVIVAGMGGSAIAGDFLQALCYTESDKAVTVVRGYHLPRWADERTLVIACSHSGNTEETLAIYEQARQRGCKLAASTTGGSIKALAGAAGVPLLAYDFYPEPRSAFGHSFVRLLAIARAAAVLDVTEARMQAAIEEIESMQPSLGEDVPDASNPAKALATRLFDRLGLVIGAEFLAPVARRWKTQLNENSGCWAIWDELPELHHNTVVGLTLPAQTAKSIHAVILEHPALTDRVRLRCQITTELFDRSGISYERLEAGGPESLAAMLRSVYLGSMVSYYLALLNNVHPSEIDNINYLKDRLAG
ncbi:MAG TPA: bifunctional phosphoglucose/phosphomannose isomerase [Dehalococcoidia bacterium]|nr:bifunctional phosphoglucose/phosphomannose isomerase [Dehalococcoidia bacterium]